MQPRFRENWNLCKFLVFKAIYASRIRNRSRISEAIINMLMERDSPFCFQFTLYVKNTLNDWCNANPKVYILYFCKAFHCTQFVLADILKSYFFLMWHLYRYKSSRMMTLNAAINIGVFIVIVRWKLLYRSIIKYRYYIWYCVVQTLPISRTHDILKP